MSKLSDKIKKAKVSVELKEEFKDVSIIKKQLEDLKEMNKIEFAPEEIPKIQVIQIPMKTVKLEELEDYTIAYLRELHMAIFGTHAPHHGGIGKKWIANKIRASFKVKSGGKKK